MLNLNYFLLCLCKKKPRFQIIYQKSKGTSVNVNATQKRKITQNSADGSFKYTFYGVYRILLFHALVPLSCFH